MSEPRMIKEVVKIMCPHCSKEALLSLRSYSSSIDWALKKEDLTTAKEKLKKEIEKITFSDPKKKEEILLWIDKEEFMVGPDEVDPMLIQIEKDNKKE